MEEPGGNYIKWNKPDIEGRALYNSIEMWNQKQSNSWKQRIEEWLPTGEGRVTWGLAAQWVSSFSFAG